MNTNPLFKNVFDDFASVIQQQSGTNMVKIGTQDLSAGWANIQTLFSDYYTNSVSFPSLIPPGFSSIQNDISSAVTALQAGDTSLSVAVGVTLDRSALEYVQFTFTLNKNYDFTVPGTSETVTITTPSLSIFIYDSEFNAGYAAASSSLNLSIGVQFLGIDSLLQLSVPSFVASISASSSLSGLDSFLTTLGCSNQSLNNIIASATGIFTAVIFIPTEQFNLNLTIDADSKCSWCGFALQEIAIDLAYFSELSFTVAAQIQISDGNNSAAVDITMIDTGSGALSVDGEVTFYPALDVGGVLNDLTNVITSATLPSFPFDLSIVSLSLGLSEDNGALSELIFDCVVDLILQDSGTSIQIEAGIDYTPTDDLNVNLFVENIILTDTKSSNMSVYTATLDANTTLSVETLIQFFNLEALQNFPFLQDVSVTALFLAAGSSGTPKPHLFGVQLKITDAVITENILSFVTGSKQMGLDSFTVFAANQKWQATDIAQLSGSVSGFTFPSELQQGLSLFAGVNFGGQSYNLPLNSGAQGGSQSGSQGDTQGSLQNGATSGSLGATQTAQPTPVSDQNSIRWFNVQKQLGPIFVGKIGFKITDQNNVSTLELATDATITIGPLVATLDDFNFTLPLTWNISITDISVGLQGLNLSYAKPPLTISGGLVHTTQGGEDLYLGNILVETGTLLLSAFGEYADVTAPDGSEFKSLALFAALNDPPLGGSPFCFITGLAAGFGYNSQLNIPSSPDQIPGFALLTAAGTIPSGGQPPDITTITKCISPSAGSNWVAAGILFTSFEFVNSTVLLTAAFGNDLQFAILGQSEMSLPPASDEMLAYAQIDVEATYVPSKGLIEVYGILTNNSYILSHDCHLTGGFAYVLYSSGDFVLSYGGYAPLYNYQQYNYPAIPRVQFLWQIDSHTYIKGDQYFAITPAVMMVGGALEATWSCGIFSAWFDVQADLFMVWRPFSYSGGFSMQLGVEFSLHIWFVHIHFSFQVGAQIQIEGPPFRGQAYIDLDVVSFTIDFGPSSSPPPPLSWSDFRQILPPGGTAVVNPQTNAITESDSSLVLASVTSGLLLDLSQSASSRNDPDWIVNGTSFCIQFQCNAPITNLDSGGSIGTATLPATTMGILPMAIGSATGTLKITITNIDQQVIIISGNPKFNIEFVKKNMATAHWGESTPQDTNTQSMLLYNVCQIYAERGTLDETTPIPVSNLQNTPQVTAFSSRSASSNPFAQS